MKPTVSFLKRFTKPLRYIGCEFNARHKPFDSARVRFCLVYPDLYEIGMSHLGLKILYEILNENPDYMSDRAFCPDKDLEAYLTEHGIPLWGLESRRPLNEFDCIAITLPYELCFINILTVLSLSKIPFYAKDRDEGHPIILGGGSVGVQPEPVAPFFDAILVGDGERAILEIADAIKEYREKRLRKEELLLRLGEIEGVYVPLFFDEVREGRFTIAKPRFSHHKRVKRRIEPDLSNLPFPVRQVVPVLNTVHDRLSLEISRGCTRGCRFCQAGIIYRPVRERPPQEIIRLAKEGINSTGWEELSFLSLSTGDYSCLNYITHELIEYFYDRRVSVSLPSLRVGSLNDDLMRSIRKVRKTGFTIAPEAATSRLRDVINKDISEEKLIETAILVCKNGWRALKLYFMIGLPTEEEGDVQGIIELVKRIKRELRPVGDITITVSVGLFVPKAHTPFQWEGQLPESEAVKRLNILKDGLKLKNTQLKWQDTRMSVMECIFSRGDRDLSRLLVQAWKKGARLDGWSDYFDSNIYIEAGRELDLDLSKYLEPISIEEPLPWSHIDVGVRTEFLLKERERAYKGEKTGDCRWGRCHGCGVCDLKVIKPVCHSDVNLSHDNRLEIKEAKSNKKYYYLLEFTKKGYSSLIGHIDLVKLFQRALTRAGLPLAYSQGHNPQPVMTFDQPLPLGIQSECEQLLFALERPVDASLINLGDISEGVSVKSISFLGQTKRLREWNMITYRIELENISQVKELYRHLIDSDKIIEYKDLDGTLRRIRLNKLIKDIRIDSFNSERPHLVLSIRCMMNRNIVRIDNLIKEILGDVWFEVIILDKTLIHENNLENCLCYIN